MQFDQVGMPFVLKGVHPRKVKMVNEAPSAKCLQMLLSCTSWLEMSLSWRCS